MSSKFESHYERVVGGSSEDQSEARKELQAWLEEHDYEDTKPYERSASETDANIIALAESWVDHYVTSYGGNPKPFPPESILILEEGSVPLVTEGKLRGGFHSLLSQRIAVERSQSDVSFAACVAHELLHAKSYKAVQVFKDGDIGPYRSGLRVFDRTDEGHYFTDLEEAIVVESTDRFFKTELIQNPLFISEINALTVVKRWVKKSMEIRNFSEDRQRDILDQLYSLPHLETIAQALEGEVDSDDPEMYKIGYIDSILIKAIQEENIGSPGRERERKAFKDTLEEILEKSGRKFTSTDEVFEEFARANFSGNLLPLARTIENILGKGAFRKIANKFRQEFSD
ncbi:MAG: hypothetical protein COU08_04430 [Candidatus Harrisonbacteria bacterium CG10_big_fil_rev_8_21_14_0_10_42_17]|uniref:Uncharacterized protein n=1 Tax=Candidatus Harrisonbacteria bacterium CG10_big_fil_rev_8_21_14_0_10_42_17 TaxID=1974584 RepID=A0A2M6WH05_9BACT|nr:MAG: hypothetical protein COU08_04430 [Candidatus Harrisonbacteria bacterium CG10_big_fil_rev_8_21_14_0_10_42_17]